MAFLALALVDTGREREAVSLPLAALAPHLPQYQKTVANYARLLVQPESAGPSAHGHVARTHPVGGNGHHGIVRDKGPGK